MNFLKEEGFVIKRINYSEADRFLTFYTKNSGKIEIMAKGVRKLSSKRSSYVELLNRVRFQAVEGRKGLILTEVELIESYTNLRHTRQTINYLFYLCELINKLCPEKEANEDVFDLLVSTLESIQKKEDLLYFQKNLLKILGFLGNDRDFLDIAQTNHYIENIIEKKLHTYKFL